jgi:hypothetical protein
MLRFSQKRYYPQHLNQPKDNKIRRQKVNWKHLKTALIVLFVVLAGCNLPLLQSNTVEVAEAPTNTPTEPPTQAPTTRPVDTDTPEPSPAPTEPPAPPTDTPETAILHVIFPDTYAGESQTIHDQVQEDVAPEKRAYGGDEWGKGRYERPFTSQDMEYLPFVDLVRADLFRPEEAEWIYASLLLDRPPNLGGERNLVYGIDLDLDLDGRGDVMIIAMNPAGTDWTTDDVFVWEDINQNIGDETPMKPDAPTDGDGYEVTIFEAGRGSDPDLAWVRISPENENQVDFAFKYDLVDIGEDYYIFLWGGWALAKEFDPAEFDPHDKYTLEEAGSPYIDNAEYPLKAFHSTDSTCRALSGMEPTVQLPGMCPISVTVPPPVDPSTTITQCPWEPCPALACFYWSFVSCSCVPCGQ